jgi:hypothetical protein
MTAATATHGQFRLEEIEHIGPTQHALRNAFVVLALISMTALLAFFYWPSESSQGSTAAELGAFRQSMYNRCGDPDFKGSPDRRLVDTYEKNSDLRSTVVAQFQMLQRETTQCEDVRTALRKAGYPIR